MKQMETTSAQIMSKKKKIYMYANYIIKIKK